jgi:hypothetical protein
MLWSVFTPQAQPSATLTEVKVPVGGGMDCSLKPVPQQTIVSSVLTPHAPTNPALTDVNVPVGGVN